MMTEGTFHKVCYVNQIISQWLQTQASPLTRSCYRRDVDRLLAYTGKSLARLTLGDLQSFSESLIAAGLAPVSRARAIATVRSLFSFCQRMHYCPVNAAAELPLPRYENRLAERVLSEEEVQRLLSGDPQPRDRTLLSLLYFAGLRVSEACNIRWRNLHFRGDGGQVTVYGKNGRTRAIPLPAPVWSDLASIRGAAGPEDPVFPSRSGRPLDRGRVRVIVRQAARRAGIDAPASPHWLRHAHASHALDHGAPIHLVQATLGHSSVATTSAYLHARPGDSSARFLAAETFLTKSVKSALPLNHTGVMDVHDRKRGTRRFKMKTFTIDEQNITAFGSQEEAAAATATPFDSFGTQKELAALIAAWPAERAAAIWNSLPGVTSVKGFKRSKAATSRIWKRIQGLGSPEKPKAEASAPKAARKATGGARAAKGAPSTAKATNKTRPAKNAPKAQKAAKGRRSTGPRDGSKTAQVVWMMQRKGGATLAEIMERMGWQKHTVRGFMAGTMKRAGYSVESFKPEGGERTYRINPK
jgi:integrase/recombinase XerD